MNVVLWVVAGLLALAFLAAGLPKTTGKREQMIAKTPYVEVFPQGAVKAIGVAEVLGALGLVVPALTGIAAGLVPVAATGLALLMAGAVVTHLRRGDGVTAAVPGLVLGLLAAFVAWGRFGPYAF
jgi:uncharacterized membrane protein